jgi:hypothetical protein
MNILFFHRLDLIHLYAPISLELNESHKIIHVAFSDSEQEILIKKYGIKNNIFNLTTIRDNFLDNHNLVNVSIKDLDEFIVKNTDRRFNLNTSIYLDRTYKNLTLDECFEISLAYYKTWELIFNETKPQLFFHEPPALFVTHLASIFCKYFKSLYLTQIHVIGENKFQWLFLEGDNANPIEINLNSSSSISEKQKQGINEFINYFISDNSILMADFTNKSLSASKIKTFTFAKRLMGLLLHRVKDIKDESIKIHPKKHISRFLLDQKRDFFLDFENAYGRIYHNIYSEPIENEKFYFYPLHLEPEAVVLYYADGWYEGQIKLIENIAMQLPAGTFLYVKDHPHGGDYRNMRDYKRLLQVKNVKLMHPSVSGKALIRCSLGVITINGTAGFEALLMKKYVFCFGKAFYSNFKGIKYLNHIKELKNALLNINLNQENSFDYVDVYSFLESSHEGFVSYFSGRQNKVGIDLYLNAKVVAKGIKTLISKLEKANF